MYVIQFLSGCLAVLVQLIQPVVRVYESEQLAEICAGKNIQTIVDLELDLIARNGSAVGN